MKHIIRKLVQAAIKLASVEMNEAEAKNIKQQIEQFFRRFNLIPEIISNYDPIVQHTKVNLGGDELSDELLHNLIATLKKKYTVSKIKYPVLYLSGKNVSAQQQHAYVIIDMVEEKFPGAIVDHIFTQGGDLILETLDNSYVSEILKLLHLNNIRCRLTTVRPKQCIYVFLKAPRQAATKLAAVEMNEAESAKIRKQVQEFLHKKGSKCSVSGSLQQAPCHTEIYIACGPNGYDFSLDELVNELKLKYYIDLVAEKYGHHVIYLSGSNTSEIKKHAQVLLDKIEMKFGHAIVNFHRYSGMWLDLNITSNKIRSAIELFLRKEGYDVEQDEAFEDVLRINLGKQVPRQAATTIGHGTAAHIKHLVTRWLEDNELDVPFEVKQNKAVSSITVVLQQALAKDVVSSLVTKLAKHVYVGKPLYGANKVTLFLSGANTLLPKKQAGDALALLRAKLPDAVVSHTFEDTGDLVLYMSHANHIPAVLHTLKSNQFPCALVVSDVPFVRVHTGK